MTWIRILACAALAASPAAAQSSVDSRYATWLGVFAHGPIAGDAWLWLDAQARFHDTFEPQAILLRPGLSWRARSDLYATVGYAWTPSWSRSAEPRAWGDLEFADEHRIWEQLLYSPSDRRTGLTGQVRVRLEQRFRSAGPFDVGVRLRMLLRVQAPLDRDRRFFVVAWDELFVAFNDAATWQTGGLDQNRFFFGWAWQAIPAQLRFELGYANQWLVRGGADPVHHIALASAVVGWS